MLSKRFSIANIAVTTCLVGCSSNDPSDFSAISSGPYECIGENPLNGREERMTIIISAENKEASFMDELAPVLVSKSAERILSGASANKSIVSFGTIIYAEGQERWKDERDAVEQSRIAYELDTNAGTMSRTIKYYSGFSNTPSYVLDSSFKCQLKA